MANSSNLVDKKLIRLNIRMNVIKKGEACGVKYKYCDCFLEYKNVKNELILFKCFYCNKSYQQRFGEFLGKNSYYTNVIIALKITKKGLIKF